MTENVRVLLPDGRTTSTNALDVEMGERLSEETKIVTEERIDERVHGMPENWLRTRMRGWMDLTESPNRDWWIGSYTNEGKWIWASSNKDSYVPMMFRIDFARRICRYVNRECHHGGAWFTGWQMGGDEFVMIWKDPDGDIQLSLPCDRPFVVIQGWKFDDWAEICEQAWKAWCDWQDACEIKAAQQVKLGQGQKMDVDNHLAEAPPIGI